MRIILVALMVALGPSCSHHECKNGATKAVCNYACVHGNKKGRIANCSCSANCPCWQDESHKGR